MMIMPRKIASVPSVTTIGGMPRKAIEPAVDQAEHQAGGDRRPGS